MLEEGKGDWGVRLVEFLSQVPDPRRRRGIRHPLPAILTPAVCAMLGGARSLYAMGQGASRVSANPGI